MLFRSQEGRLLQYGPLQQVYHNPAYVEVGSYFSYPTMNIMEATAVRDQGRSWLKVTDEITMDVTAHRDQLSAEQYLVGIRAYNLYTRKTAEHLISFQATVELTEELGSDTELHVRHQDKLFIVLMQEVTRYAIGTEITVYLDPSRLFLFDPNTRELVLKTFG